MAQSTLDIIQAISKIISTKGHDGREEGYVLNDSRVIDGFSVNFSANKLAIKYQVDVKKSEIAQNTFESNIEDMILKVSKFLKSEYNKETGKTLSLKPEKDSFKALVQSTSSARTWIEAQMWFKIGGLDDVDELDAADSRGALEKSFLDWAKGTKKTGDKPRNVMISKKDNQKE